MGKAKQGKQEVIFCTCPSCQTRIILDDEGNILHSFYEPDEKEAERKAEQLGAGNEEEENGTESSGEETISEDSKEEIEKEAEAEEEQPEEQPEEEGSEDDEFKLGEGW